MVKKKSNVKKIFEVVKGFFNFDKLYAEVILKIIYFLTVILSFFVAFYTVEGFFSKVFFILVYNLILRVCVELVLVLFRINKKLK